VLMTCGSNHRTLHQVSVFDANVRGLRNGTRAYPERG
jgi:hypothetical protein